MTRDNDDEYIALLLEQHELLEEYRRITTQQGEMIERMIEDKKGHIRWLKEHGARLAEEDNE